MKKSANYPSIFMIALAVGGGTILHYVAPELVPFALVAIVVYVVGQTILERLPNKPRQHFTFELPDDYVTFRIETILEDEFKVTFIDDWETGRAFSLYGSVIPGEGEPSSDAPAFGKRTGVKIGGMPDWFQTSRIGGIRTFERGGCECFVALPYQIARDALNEVRRDPNQLVTLGYKRMTHKDGKVTFPIFSFELTKPLD